MRDEALDLHSYIDQITLDVANGNRIYTDTISTHAVYPAYINLPMGNYLTEQVEKALDFYFQHHPEELL